MECFHSLQNERVVTMNFHFRFTSDINIHTLWLSVPYTFPMTKQKYPLYNSNFVCIPKIRIDKIHNICMVNVTSLKYEKETINFQDNRQRRLLSPICYGNSIHFISYRFRIAIGVRVGSP